MVTKECVGDCSSSCLHDAACSSSCQEVGSIHLVVGPIAIIRLQLTLSEGRKQIVRHLVRERVAHVRLALLRAICADGLEHVCALEFTNE